MADLFNNFKKFVHQKALDEFRGSALGRMVDKVRHARQRGVGRTVAGRAKGKIERYAKGGGIKQRVINQFLRALGPLGDVISELLTSTAPQDRSREQQRLNEELDIAADFLRAFDYEVTPPRKQPPPIPKPTEPQPQRPGVQTAPPGTLTTIPPRPQIGAPGKVQLKIGGRQLNVDESDPIITGEMVDVESSNVHSIGFIWNGDNAMAGTLKVRFLQSRGKRQAKGPGPLYYYYNVHPFVFQSFRDAASKGKFVWDRLRIRGTVSGHQYRYALKGFVNGYVPRQAKRYGENEYFVQRRVTAESQTSGQRKTFTSTLPDRFVQTARPQQPNRGLPNRGRPAPPNRGRPT